jgi:CHAD domain-containing protein
MSFRFEIDESSFKGIQRIAGERTDRVLRAVSKKPYPNSELIHQARKDLKSLRALLRLARASMPEENYIRENTFFRDVGRSLSAARDRQVILEAIERFQGKPKKLRRRCRKRLYSKLSSISAGACSVRLRPKFRLKRWPVCAKSWEKRKNASTIGSMVSY